MRKIEQADVLALGFSPEEAVIFATPMKEWAKLGINPVSATALSDRITAAVRAKQAAEYVRPERHRQGFSISDHVCADGDNLWHPNVKAHIGSKSQFRKETAARGGDEVGNEYKAQAASDNYDLKPTAQQKAIVRDRLDNVLRQVDHDRARLVPRRA